MIGCDQVVIHPSMLCPIRCGAYSSIAEEKRICAAKLSGDERVAIGAVCSTYEPPPLNENIYAAAEEAIRILVAEPRIRSSHGSRCVVSLYQSIAVRYHHAWNLLDEHRPIGQIRGSGCLVLSIEDHLHRPYLNHVISEICCCRPTTARSADVYICAGKCRTSS